MAVSAPGFFEMDDAPLRLYIEDMFSDYVHAIDDDQIETWPDYFTETGFYQIISRESFEAGHAIGVMHCDGRGMMKDRVKAMREANLFEPHRYCHVMERPRLRHRQVSRLDRRVRRGSALSAAYRCIGFTTHRHTAGLPSLAILRNDQAFVRIPRLGFVENVITRRLTMKGFYSPNKGSCVLDFLLSAVAKQFICNTTPVIVTTASQCVVNIRLFPTFE